MLLAICLRYTAVREDAEDVMHESLLRILKGLDRFKPRFSGSFEVWMRRITVNMCLNFLRERMKAQTLKDMAAYEPMDEETEPSADSSLPEKLEPEAVIELIGGLPPGYRTVLNLYVFDNYSHKEIASALGITENTSKSQLSKARALLRKKVNSLWNHKQLVENERK